MKKFIKTVLNVAIVITVAFVLINPNPALADNCDGKCPEDHSCIRWGADNAWTCVVVDCCDTKLCTEDTESCIKIDPINDEAGVCATVADTAFAKAWLHKRSQRRGNYRTSKAKKVLEAEKAETLKAKAALEAVKTELKDTCKSYMKALEAESALLTLDMTLAKDESKKSHDIWTTTKPHQKIQDERNALMTAVTALDEQVIFIDKEGLDIKTLACNKVNLDEIKAKFQRLQSLHAKLNKLTAKCQKAREEVKEEDEETLADQLQKDLSSTEDTVKNLRTALYHPRNHHLFAAGGVTIAGVNTDAIISEIQAGYDVTYYWEHFQLFARIAFQAGSLSSGNGYWGPDANVGFRAGKKLVWLQIGGGGGYVFPTNESDGTGLANFEVFAGPMVQVRNIAAFGIMAKYTSEMPVGLAPNDDSYSEKDLFSLMVEITFGLGPTQKDYGDKD
jgi:hypothetical protein